MRQLKLFPMSFLCPIAALAADPSLRIEGLAPLFVAVAAAGSGPLARWMEGTSW
jgi:hypothetical protein